MTAATAAATAAAEPPGRVSSLELFFDLVFVFTVTQFTRVLTDAPDLVGLAQVVVMLGVVFWMYGGYAWLTNAVPLDRAEHRLLLLGGMGAFLVLALAIPGAFSGSGATFGIAYLVIVLLHAGLYTRAASASSAAAILTIAPFNVASALLVLAGGILGGTAQWVMWAAAFVLEWATPWLGRLGSFELAPAHFVERHGLLIIIALGESVVAIGIGAEGLAVDAGLVATALLGLALAACLWWTYFSDEAGVEEAMHRLPRARAPAVAILGFGYAHLTMLLGIVAAAVGTKKAIAEAAEALGWAVAAFAAGGVTLFVLSDVVFRAELRLPRDNRVRVAGALLALATIPVGALVGGAAQLAALVAVLGGALAAEAVLLGDVRRRRRAGAPGAPAPPARDG